MGNRRVRVDLSESRIDPIPEATGYHLRISNASDEIESRSGKGKYITYTFEIVDGSEAGKTVKRNFMTNGKGAGMIDDLFEICGCPITVGDDKVGELDPDEIVGREILGDIVITQPDADNGLRRPRSELDNYYAIS